MLTTKPTDPVRAKAAALELLRDEEPAMTTPTTTLHHAVPVRTRKAPPYCSPYGFPRAPLPPTNEPACH